MQQRETEEMPKRVLDVIVENFEVAEEDQRPLCADVGVSRVYAVVGNDALIDGGFVVLERAVRQATARVTQDLALRSKPVSSPEPQQSRQQRRAFRPQHRIPF